MQPQDTAGTYRVDRLGTDRRMPLRNRIERDEVGIPLTQVGLS